MTTFVDGPAAAVTLMLRRQPLFLRVVVGADGKIDALDLLDDTPAPSEMVHVYRRSVAPHGHVCTRGQGCYAIAEYRYVPDVDGELLRDEAPWRKWCERQAEQEGLLV